MPILRRLDFEYSKMPPYILMRDYFEFLRAIPLQRVGCIRVTHPSATLLPFGLTVRLACIRPAASVHPEPGSNSSLYISISFFSFPVLGSIFGINFFSLSLPLRLFGSSSQRTFSLQTSSPSLLSYPLSVFSECKITPFFFLYNTFFDFFYLFFIPIDYHYFIPYSTLTPTPVFASSCPLPPLFFSFLYIVSTPFSHFPSFLFSQLPFFSPCYLFYTLLI